MIIREFWVEDEDELDEGDIAYDAKAYYFKSQSNRYGLADDAKFANAYELDEWIWSRCQEGLYVEIYDYEDNKYRWYQWPENAEYLDLSSVYDLETNRKGNFLNIEDIGLK